MRAIVFALGLATGCSSLLGLDTPDRIGDAGHDDGGALDASTCVGSGKLAFCLDAPPSAPLTVTSLDTDQSPLCGAIPAEWTAQGQPPSCFVIATDLDVAGTARFSGSRPIVLVATNAIAVQGTLDVSSRGTLLGAGAQPAFCGTPSDGADRATGGGGAGGSFITAGANGGTGDGNTAGRGVAAAAVPPPGILRGGCSGSAGGNANVPAGPGGGAIYLVAGNQIMLGATAIINASGAGGRSDTGQTGGAGGGSGGMIALHAPLITAQAGATLIANGGGGAAGGANTKGPAGRDPSPSTPTTPAAGGAGQNGAGSGGAGSTGLVVAGGGTNGAAGTGGGGGGGGAGYILSSAALDDAITSPPVVIAP